MTHRILDLPQEERPRERLRKLGSQALSSEELLAILLGSGTKNEPVLKLARELLVRFRSLQALGEAGLEELQSIPGIGLAKALKLKAAFSLAERAAFKPDELSAEVKSPEKAFKIAKPYIEHEKREVFLLLLLNIKARLIGVEIISIGTLSATLVHPREVFYPAIKRKASSLIAIHNHPSGDLTPSKEDLKITQALVKAGTCVDIPLVDHLIISPHHYYSMREQGFNFTS